MFVTVVIRPPTQLTRVKTAVSFKVHDPWNSNRPAVIDLDDYLMTLRGIAGIPSSTPAPTWDGGFHRALRSRSDGVVRYLPESLIELWQTQRVPIDAIPRLLNAVEPTLRRGDYRPILRSLRMKIFALYLAYFGKLRRRRRQMEWFLERHATTNTGTNGVGRLGAAHA